MDVTTQTSLWLRSVCSMLIHVPGSRIVQFRYPGFPTHHRNFNHGSFRSLVPSHVNGAADELYCCHPFLDLGLSGTSGTNVNAFVMNQIEDTWRLSDA